MMSPNIIIYCGMPLHNSTQFNDVYFED